MVMMVGLLLQLLPSHVSPLLILLYFSVLMLQDGTVFLQRTALDVGNDGMRRYRDETMKMGNNNINGKFSYCSFIFVVTVGVLLRFLPSHVPLLSFSLICCCFRYCRGVGTCLFGDGMDEFGGGRRWTLALDVGVGRRRTALDVGGRRWTALDVGGVMMKR